MGERSSPDIVDELYGLADSLMQGSGKTVVISYANIRFAADEIKRLRASLQPATPTSASSITGIQAADLLQDYLKTRFGVTDDGDGANIIHILHEGGVRFALPATASDAVAGEAKALAEIADYFDGARQFLSDPEMIDTFKRWSAALRSPDVAATPPEGWRLVPAEPTTAQHIAAMEFALAHMKAHGVTSLSPFKDYPPLRETTAGMYRAMVGAVCGDAAQPTALPNGWKLVPERPTHRQMDAGLYQSSADSTFQDVYSIYADMIDAAPSITDHPSDTAPVAAPTLTLSSTERK
jgi:hypothetical protein